MTDHSEEQANEVEALKSIYVDEFKELKPFQKFSITITPDIDDDTIEKDQYSCVLIITYTPKYPDELPEIKLEPIIKNSQLAKESLLKLQDELIEEGSRNLGMAMVFQLVSYIQENLANLVTGYREKQEEEERRKELELKKLQDLEEKRRLGTRVTREIFFQWKAKFDQEMAEIEREQNSAKLEAKKNKLTGRQLFEQDKTLVKSDAAFLEEGDLTVDASLFEEEDVYITDEEEEEAHVVLSDSD